MKKSLFRVFGTRAFLFSVLLLMSMRMYGVGWTPTDAGLVVNMDQGARFLLSVWIDMNGNGIEEEGEELFVSNYNRYSGGYFNYSAGSFMKLLAAPDITEMNEWTVGAPLDRGNKALGGISYTIWNDGKTLKTSDTFKFLGDLTSSYTDAKACDVVFVIPTNRGVPTVSGRAGLSSFDPNNTLGRGTAPFDGATGTGFLGMTYREVYMFNIPKANSPQSYTNAALVTFNTTLSTWNLSSGAGNIAKGRAAYAFADSKHDKTPRTIFRLYLLDDPINSCSSFFFATDEQDYVRYRMNENNPQRSSDSTAAKKIYTMDRLRCMHRVGSTQYYETDLMRVPEPDSTYYYVGYNDNYYANRGTNPPKMSNPGAYSQFTKIRQLPIFSLSSDFKVPAGAIGRMVADTTSTVDNLDVKFRPAGYFCKISTGTNIRMRPNADSTIWTCDEMWHITDAYAALQVKATMFSGPEFSETDPGIDIPGWSVFVTGNTVPLASDHTQTVHGGMDGWVRIYANRSEQNGYMEFILANPDHHIRYDYNGLLGMQVPDQYPAQGATTVTVEQPRLVSGFSFTGWTRNPDGTGGTYQPGDVIDLASEGAELTLYAQGTYTGTYHVAFSFMHSNGKRYFLTQPIGESNRYIKARPVGDWTDTYQGMADAYNSEPNYISTYKLLTGGDCPHCDPGEYVLDPNREMRHGAVDSLLFYENWEPDREVYLGLYFDDKTTPFPDPVTVIANNSWAGLFTSSEGWPDYNRATVKNAKLRSTHYLHRVNGDVTRDPRTSIDSSYVQYKEALNQFDGVVSADDATTFQISRVRVADEHYVVLPDTTKAWRDEITFGYHQGEQSREQVWSSLIGKQLMAVTIAGEDTVYFHPNRNKIINDPNNLYLSQAFRVSQYFELIHDSRPSAALNEGDSLSLEATSHYWHNDAVSGLNSPIGVTDGEGNYIDIVDTIRIRLSHGGISKIKEYYGRWKNGAAGLHVNAEGTERYRDVLVRTKTYHYGDTQTHLVLTPEFKSYTFNPLAGNSRQINFTLANVTARQLLDVDGNPIGDEEVISSEDVTLSLALGPGACSFSSGGAYFNISEAVGQHITLATKAENHSDDNLDTLIISMSVTVDDVSYPVTVRIPLVQTSLVGDELIWSVQSGNKRYYITAGTGGLIFRQYALKNSTLYKEGTSNTALIKGSLNAANSDKTYITPWRFNYNPSNPSQLALKTEYGVDRYLKIDGETPGIHPSDSSLLTYHYVDVITNENANEEELVKLQYGADKWLQFTLTGGSGAELRLVDNEADASVFSWSYLNQEYSLLNNGTYPSRDSVIFGYNTDMSVDIQTRYKAYKEYSMLVGNSVVYCCRQEEADMSDLTSGGLEWKTRQTVTLIPDARDFDGSPEPESGISHTQNALTATATVSTSGTPTSPTNVKIGGKYVNIVDTLHVTLSLQGDAPAYRFKGDWSEFRSVNDAELKIPLVRKTYHVDRYDSVVCVVGDDKYNHTFPKTITDPVSYTFELGTELHTGHHVLDVANTTIEVLDADVEDVTESGLMDLSNAAMAEMRLMDDFGNRPTWCRISDKSATTITVECTESGVRTPRQATIYIVYIVMIENQMRLVSQRLTVSQPSLFQYANNQQLVHSPGASGDPLRADGMQQVHENIRTLYYYPDQNVELPIRDYHFFGWWRWFREGEGGIGDSDIPDEDWRTMPLNTGSGKSGSYNFPFRIIGDSVWVDEEDHSQGKQLVTMGRYTVFHYQARDYNDNKKNPPVKTALVAPPITTYGVADKPTVVYAAEISNYYDHLPMSLRYKNQVDTALLDTIRAITEPTLSLREVFELHPWTEMAARMENYKSARTANDAGTYDLANENYMEDHVMMAPTGNELLLSTEQRYNYANLQKNNHSESLLGYYMRDDNWDDWSDNRVRQDTMIWCGGWDADCKWYTYNPKTRKYTPCAYTITESDDFLKVPAKENITNGQEFDTVYYCLRARSWSSEFSGPGDDATVESDSGNYMFNICRYKLIYHKPSKYGPLAETKNKEGITKALITNDEIEQIYDVLERLNFDYNEPGPEYTVYPHPLPWADASYGYTYPETPDLPHNRLHVHSDFPNHGEYGLINRIPTASHWGDGVTSYWRPMEQHGGASNGYMIYCDGMSSSGQVAALTLDTTLCSGQKMFLSGYVCNPSSQVEKSNPNFIISVQGSTDGSAWDDITSYMTGGIAPSSQWNQIYFPILFNDNIAYRHFRVRIYNVAADWDGNDFIIDDLCIFATKPPLIAYQAQTTCKEYGKEDAETHVLLRVDYQGITGEGYNDTEVFYTVEQEDDKTGVVTFVDLDYLKRGVVNDTIYGKFYIPAREYEPTDRDSIFTNMNELILRYDTTDGAYKEGYIYEILEGGIRPVKYAVHSGQMDTKDDYSVHMSGTLKDLMNSICGMTSRLRISNRMVLTLDGNEQPETEQLGLCANSTYDLALRVKGSLYQDSVAPIQVTGSCINDWLLYGDTSEVSSLARYGFKYSDIVKVVRDILRCVPNYGTNRNQFAPNFASINRNELQRIKDAQKVELTEGVDPYALLDSLVSKGFLILYKPHMTTSVISGDSVQYIILPIIGTGSDEINNTNVDVCPNPIFIKLKPERESAVPLMVGGLHRDSTEMSQPVVVLASESTANDVFKLRVDSIIPMVGIYSVELRSTDDPEFREGFHTLSLMPDKDYPRGDYYLKGDSIVFSPSASSNYQMRAGYNYTFNILMQTMGGSLKDEYGCEVGVVPFTMSIVPDYLRWEPKNPADSRWNNADNWIGVTSENQPIHDAAFFAPLASTHVLIPAMEDGMPYPELPQLPLAHKDSVQKVNFSYNACDIIHFLPGAAIGQQQRMDYGQALVDMSMPQKTWALRAAPVTGLISGDLFMSNVELQQGNKMLWEVGEFDASGRNHNTGNASFWLSVYSRETIRKGNNDNVKDTTRTAAAEWSKVTNALTLSLPPAQGWAVYSRTKSEQDANVRLPKNDDIYYYYYTTGGRVDDMYEQNLQTMRSNLAKDQTGGNAGELAFHPVGTSQNYTLTNEAESSAFVFGNPTMGFIDIWGFLADNSLTGEISYINRSGNYTTITKAAAELTQDTITNLSRYLPPMHAMVVDASSAVTSLDVTLNANRIVTSPAGVVRPLPAGAPSRMTTNDQRLMTKGIMTVTAINPVSSRCTSRLLLGQGFRDDIYLGEDAMLTTVNIDNYSTTSAPATPFNIYACEGDYGLSIDLRDSIVNVPLSFYMSDLPFDQTTQLWFTGVNNISGQLVLYDTISGTQRPIIDGICLNIETPEQSHLVRYYIRRNGYNPNNPSNPVTTDVRFYETDEEGAVKIVRKGHVYILRNGQIYTVLGQKVR